MGERFPLGKLPNRVLSELLAKIDIQDPRVVVGPGVGLDAAVIDFGERYLVVKTDPITFATDWLGWYAVHVNANDLACMGATPSWFLGTLLLPEGAEREQAQQVFDQIRQACQALEVELVGGHTEITHGIDHPILIGCLLGEVEKARLVTAAGARAGDAVLLAGGVPIEAVSIIAREKAEALKDRFNDDYLERCRRFLFEPGISVVKAARLAQDSGEIHAMHDPTEGGLATGLWELAQASGLRIEVRRRDIAVLPEGQALCDAMGLDPLASIASGALLLCLPADEAGRVCSALERESLACQVVGEVIEAGEPEVVIHDQDGTSQLPLPDRDEIAKLFETT